MQPWRPCILGLSLLIGLALLTCVLPVGAQSDMPPTEAPSATPPEPPTAPPAETPTVIATVLPTETLLETATEIPTETFFATLTEAPLTPASLPTVTPTALSAETPLATAPVAAIVPLTITATDAFTAVTATPTAAVVPVESTPTASPTATPLPTDTTVPPAIPTEIPTPTLTETPPLVTALPATPLPATPPPHLLITEFLADPKAVTDEQGEWVELYNADTLAVNLRGWVLADLDNDRHIIAADLLIQPGQYLVLARTGEAALNGGVAAAYVYQNLALANSSDELVLLTPDGMEIDRVLWGDGTALTVKAGASVQRTAPASSALWEVSQDPWPGSAGDKGTPGSAYQPPAVAPTTTPTDALSPDATPGAAWPLAATPSDLQIDEVFYRGSDDEYIVLQNTGTTPLDLTGWLIGDAEAPTKGEGIYALPTGTVLAAGDLLVLARDGLVFRNQWGRSAQAEFAASDTETPDLVRRRDLVRGDLALNDNGDEVLLFNPAGFVADAVAFDNGAYTLLGLTGLLDAPKGYALHRVPAARFPVVNEVRQRFLYAPPDPFTALTLPAPLPQASTRLDDDLWVVWGSLGAQSIFTPGGTAPPHYLLAAAAAQGLNFLAVADPLYREPWQNTAGLVALPAWRWSNGEDADAVVYDAQPQAFSDQAALLAHLAATGSVAQWQQSGPPAQPAIVGLAADAVSAPEQLAALAKAWFAAGAPLLPVGNANPPLPGAVAPTPRYTGLAVAAIDSVGIKDALAAHRGWLTSKPGLWLALHAQVADGSRRWMGATVAAENQITLHVDYGDNLGGAAGVAIWQDDKPIQQLATPLLGGRWTVTVPAVPNSFLYAVATQANGDFAVTAPLYVLPTTGGAAIVLNEVLPAPGADHNGDGAINSDDEYIELYNPGDHPMSLVGWQLSDAAGRHFAFGPGRFIGGHSYLLVRRTETRINLNNADDAVQLLAASGAVIDQIAWAQSPRRGHSLSRLPDGGAWQEGAATPGQANKATTEAERTTPPDDHDDHENADDEPPPVRLAPTYGQAGGSPASIAQSKLAGLEQWVEFRAVVTAPPGLYNATIYVADPAPDGTVGPIAGIGINVYLHNGEFPALAEGDWVLVRGVLRSFRGEMELQLESPTQIWRLDGRIPLQSLPVAVAEIGEALEGRLVTFTGSVSGWQGDSLFLVDPNQPDEEGVRVTVRSSLPWKRPYVQKGQRWQVTGIVSQFAREAPWNGGYRVLVRYKEDLVKLKK